MRVLFCKSRAFILLLFLTLPQPLSADSVTALVPALPETEIPDDLFRDGIAAKWLTCDNAKTLDFSTTKTAIIIGEAQYTDNRALPTVRNDLLAIYEALTNNNYNVQCFIDLTSQQLDALLHSIGDRIFTYHGDFLFYISGHGWTDGSTNFVVGIDASFTNLRAGSVDIDTLVERVSYSKANQSVLLFDICRQILGLPVVVNRPTNIEAKVRQSRDVIIGYSAGFASFAPAGNIGEKYSAYAGALAGYMDPLLGWSVQEILANVQTYIRDKSNIRDNSNQTPSFVSFSARDIFLNRKYSYLKGMRSVREAEDILEARDAFETEIPDGRERRSVYAGISFLIRSTLIISSSRACNAYFKSLEEEYRARGKYQDMMVYPCPVSTGSLNVLAGHLAFG